MVLKLETVRDALAGRYEVEKKVGRGGMATVFRARRLNETELFAIKVLHPEFAATLVADRFHREIAILADLDHPNIVPLLESEKVGSLVYYVMPYAREASLRERLDNARWLPIDETIRITTDIAAALDYAHAHNVVHRDIKPENIMFDGGRAKVCDFGVARAIVRAGGEGISSSGLVVGTPAYMSPEQASGSAPVGGRSDLYSLACLVYEMLIGEPPFTGRTAQAIMARQVRQPPPSLRVVRAEIPEHMEGAIHRALAKRPEERPRNGATLVTQLCG